MCRVAVVAGVGVYAEGIACGLSREGLDVAGTATDAVGALRMVGDAQPDVVLVDMATPAALSLLEVLAPQGPRVRTIALAVDEAEDLVIACAEAGVAGYVPRDATLSEVAGIARAAAAGEAACSPRIVARLLHRVAVLAADRPGAGAGDELTRRESQVVGLIDDGLSNKEIARELRIEVATVKNHVHNILGKLQVTRRAEAAALVRRGRDGQSRSTAVR